MAGAIAYFRAWPCRVLDSSGATKLRQMGCAYQTPETSCLGESQKALAGGAVLPLKPIGELYSRLTGVIPTQCFSLFVCQTCRALLLRIIEHNALEKATRTEHRLRCLAGTEIASELSALQAQVSADTGMPPPVLGTLRLHC